MEEVTGIEFETESVPETDAPRMTVAGRAPRDPDSFGVRGDFCPRHEQHRISRRHAVAHVHAPAKLADARRPTERAVAGVLVVHVHGVVCAVIVDGDVKRLADHVRRQHLVGTRAMVQGDVAVAVGVDHHGPVVVRVLGLKDGGTERLDDGVRAPPLKPAVSGRPIDIRVERLDAGGVGPVVLDVNLVLEEPKHLRVSVFLIPARPLGE